MPASPQRSDSYTYTASLFPSSCKHAFEPPPHLLCPYLSHQSFLPRTTWLFPMTSYFAPCRSLPRSPFRKHSLQAHLSDYHYPFAAGYLLNAQSLRQTLLHSPATFPLLSPTWPLCDAVYMHQTRQAQVKFQPTSTHLADSNLRAQHQLPQLPYLPTCSPCTLWL